jgi:ATP-dependent Lhr-like helicase
LTNGTDEELCDYDVLDALSSKSLAKVRSLIEPVDELTLARFMPEWQGVNTKRRGRAALFSVIAELRGCPLIASALEADVLPARIEDYRSWDLDALCAAGEVVWAGIEPLGSHDARIALYTAKDEPLLARPIVAAPGPVAATIREFLARRGAVFFPEIARAVGGFPAEALQALWQMVWAGEVTNDTLEPLRSRVRAESARRTRPRQARPPASPSGRQSASAAPAGSEGRWSLRASRWPAQASDTDRRAALARALLDRYGIVTREAAHAEGIERGFAAVYDVLKAFENQGRVRRGYFIKAHGGAQFALPGAEESLRALKEEAGPGVPTVLAATDPANVWGALLEWPSAASPKGAVAPGPSAASPKGAVAPGPSAASPKAAAAPGPSPAGAERPRRAAGARVVLWQGRLLGWLGPGAHPLLTFLPPDGPARSESAAAMARALARLVDGKGRRALLISTIDGVPAAQSALAPAFAIAGFAATMRGLLKRARSAQDDMHSQATLP